MTIKNTSFIHFNDIYNVDHAPKFVASIKDTKKRLKASHSADGSHDGSEHSVITIFSGDAFSPSIMSTVLRGEQMVPVLNALDIDVACLGNHDLDFGVEEFIDLKEQCNFPWLCSNAWDANENSPLGGCKEFYIIDKTREGGPRILTVGLIEKSWLDTLSSVEPEDLVFEEPWDFVNRRVPELKAEHGPFDAVVAITHMRMPSDYKLAENGGVDIDFGGHDHHYEDTVINNIRILNSGTDFHNYSVVDVIGKTESGSLETTCRRVNVKSSNEEPDANMEEIVTKFQSLVNQSMDKVVGRSKVRLDARFSEIRTKETNISNFLAELLTRATGADVAILNAGTIRADRFIEAGELTMKDLCDLLPMADEMMVVSITGEKILLALENGVSQYPAMEGRFPCVDGVRFEFDPSKEPGSRVVPGSVYIRDHPVYKSWGCMSRGVNRQPHYTSVNKECDNHAKKVEVGVPRGYVPLDLMKEYSVVSKAYLISGKDGFDAAFEGAKVLRGEEECPFLPTILRNLFTQINSLKFWSNCLNGTLIEAASRFKKPVRNSIVDPFSIRPVVDGRIKNIGESKSQ